MEQRPQKRLRKECPDMNNLWGMKALRSSPFQPLESQIPEIYRTMFGKEWSLEAVFVTGSDAVAHLYTLAQIHAIRSNKTRGAVITFYDMFCTSRGPLTSRLPKTIAKEWGISERNLSGLDRSLIVPESKTPWIENYVPQWTDPFGIGKRDLDEKENEALLWISDLITQRKDGPEPITGVIFESVHASAQVALSPAFLRALCEKCREHRVLCMEDAVMTGARCGGGFLFNSERAGYQPDALAFGKVFGLGGVLASTRSWFTKRIGIGKMSGSPTSCGDKRLLDDLLSVTRSLSDPQLRERVEQSGKALRKHLVHCFAKTSEVEKDWEVARGLGLLIHTTANMPCVQFGRILPNLDITDKEIELFGKECQFHSKLQREAMIS